MKRIITFLIVGIFIFGCSSSSKHLQTGNYDAALQKSAKKIRKKPSDFEEKEVFNNAYRMAYAKDNDEITRLKAQANPANWAKIYATYLRIKSRQDLAKSLPDNGLTFDRTNFNGEIANAKAKATAYAFDNGVRLLAKNNRFDARKAYTSFLETKRFTPNYKNVDEKLQIAQLKGTTNVFYRVEDKLKTERSKQITTDLQNLDFSSLNKNWKNYDAYIDKSIKYNYDIVLSLLAVDISADQLKDSSFIEKKLVKDGFDYVLDSKGNVRKDSLGNDIKTYNYRNISATVQRFTQSKSIRMKGVITYINKENSQILKKENIVANHAFTHNYTVATGDTRALTAKTVQDIKVPKKAYPKDAELIIQGVKSFKKSTNDFIIANKNLIK